MAPEAVKEAVRIAIGNVAVDADLHVPDRATGLVVFAHGSGSSRFSRRNRAVAGALESAGFGTLLLDLLTPHEELQSRRRQRRRLALVDRVRCPRRAAGAHAGRSIRRQQ